jgi:hypothetical protein
LQRQVNPKLGISERKYKNITPAQGKQPDKIKEIKE